MNLKKLILLGILFLISLFLHAQHDFVSKVKFEFGVNRSELSSTPIQTQLLSGGTGWNTSLLFNRQKGNFFAETGIGYRMINFLINEGVSQTNHYTVKTSSINIPVVVGSYIFGDECLINPIVKTGLNLDYTLDLNYEQLNLISKSDVRKLNLSYTGGIGAKINKIEILFYYKIDLNKYVKVITKKNRLIGLNLSYVISQK